MTQTTQEDKVCPICNGTKFILDPDGSVRKCRCQLKAEIKAYLPEFLSKYKISKTFDYSKFKGKNLYVWSEISFFASFVNTYLTFAYFKDNKPHYEILTASGLTEHFFMNDPESVSLMNSCYSSDILFLLIYAGYNNKFTSQTVFDIIKTRILYNRPTIVFIDKTQFSEAELRNRIGDDAYNTIMKNFTKVGQ